MVQQSGSNSANPPIERRVGINTGMHTRDLTDEQWTTLDPLIPKPRTRGDGRGNGTLEVSFGTAGMVTLNVPTGIGGGVHVVGVAIQTDGKIIAGISTINSDGSQ